MSKKNKRRKDKLFSSYSGCSLFKKYYQYNLWFGSFTEYHNIKYCKKYAQKYIYCWSHIFLSQRFSLFFVLFLYKGLRFRKFIKSGFYKLLDYYFLLSFHNNRFAFEQKSKKNIKVFFKSYFNKFLKDRLEKDLMILVTKFINETTLIRHLNSHLRYIDIYTYWIWLNHKRLFKLVTIKDKRKFYFVGLFCFNDLIKKDCSKSCFIDLNNLYQQNSYYPFINLKSINFKNTKTLKFDLKSGEINKLIMEKAFIQFSSKALYRSNQDVQYLIESVDSLDKSNYQEKNVGLYKNSNVLFDGKLNHKFLLSKKSFKNQLKSFNIYFIRYNQKKIKRVKFSCKLG